MFIFKKRDEYGDLISKEKQISSKFDDNTNFSPFNSYSFTRGANVNDRLNTNNYNKHFNDSNNLCFRFLLGLTGTWYSEAGVAHYDERDENISGLKKDNFDRVNVVKNDDNKNVDSSNVDSNNYTNPKGNNPVSIMPFRFGSQMTFTSPIAPPPANAAAAIPIVSVIEANKILNFDNSKGDKNDKNITKNAENNFENNNYYLLSDQYSWPPGNRNSVLLQQHRGVIKCLDNNTIQWSVVHNSGYSNIGNSNINGANKGKNNITGSSTTGAVEVLVGPVFAASSSSPSQDLIISNIDQNINNSGSSYYRHNKEKIDRKDIINVNDVSNMNNKIIYNNIKGEANALIAVLDSVSDNNNDKKNVTNIDNIGRTRRLLIQHQQNPYMLTERFFLSLKKPFYNNNNNLFVEHTVVDYLKRRK